MKFMSGMPVNLLMLRGTVKDFTTKTAAFISILGANSTLLHQ